MAVKATARRRASDWPDRHVAWRVWELYLELKSGKRPSMRRIAERLEVTKRTAERYIERMRDFLGADIRYDRKTNGYYLASPLELPAARLTEGEAISILLGQKLLSECRGAPFEAHLRSALHKMAVLLPPSVTVDTSELAEWVSFHVEPLRGDEQRVARVFQALQEAMSNRKTVHMRYYTASRYAMTERDIDPYHLEFCEGVWYVFGYCHTRGEVRTFALDRIESICLTEDRFEVRPDFSVEAYKATSWRVERGEPRHVKIRFDRDAARFIRGKTWHPTQQVVEEADGGLTMTVSTGGLGELTRWVMSFGQHARIVEPEDLRRQVAEEARAMAALYDDI